MTPITTRPVAMTASTRVEIISSVIADVLHNAYTTQIGVPSSLLSHCPSAVQRVYEGLARLAVVPLLEPDKLVVAEQKAIHHAATILGDYMDEDREYVRVGAERWEQRMTAIVRAAIATYQAELMRVTR